ncbi:MAG: hypothetical protein QOH10_299 [Actinomycetota bacterium]|jgi:uncharacterized cupredoxin-like copper-binding protein|nr:hypothetical protein [Actinomycetota bacterium]
MIRAARAALAIGAAAATAVVGYAVSDTAHAADTKPALGPGLVTVTVGIHYSRFSTSTVHVRAGSTVRFLIRNQDPIHHEFIVGDASVHARHERGSESVHPPVPGEVSVGPGELGETFSVFDKPGRYLFACHLPGHFAYGMHGWVVVDP